MPLVRPSAVLLAAALACAAHAEVLPRFNADPASVTVSGISSGGAMAIQAHVAWSGTFRHAAVFAGAAYHCAQGNLAFAIGRCQEALAASEIPVSELVATTRDWSARGLIDDVAKLAASSVYLFSGTLDQTVRQPGMDAARDYYLQFLNPSRVVYVNGVAAGHGWVSPLGPVLCAAQQSPYINNCMIDPQQAFLTLAYGPLQARQAGALGGSLVPVDQKEFLDDRNAAAHSLDDNAWLYVPDACRRGEACRLHVAFHGCSQFYRKIGDQFLRMANLNEWADTNRLLVLYPQTIDLPPTNGLGCWDWWGYDSPAYAQKGAPQMLAIKRMVDRVTAGYAPVPAPQGLVATMLSASSVRLAWQPVAGAAGYRLYRNGTALTVEALAESQFTDKAVARDASYSYTVRAVAANGNAGPASAAATATIR